ncbi:MAG: 30S ribosome-binding factor RbfA [Candidatus Omnitrophica bacterium]|nr:30S ribosome-binding factor RbfA [Candidatus Omnitrophota bacterium]
MATKKRCLRMAEFIRQEVAQLLGKMDNPGKGFFTITKAEVKSDLKTAIIYFSVLGNEKEKNKTLNYLQRKTGYLRKEIGKVMRVRYIPEIYFKFDPSIEYSMRISELLETAKK